MELLSSFFKYRLGNAPSLRLQIAMIIIVPFMIFLQTTDAEIGINYGLLGNNLPPPEEVLALCSQNNIERIRIFDPNAAVLRALTNFPTISVIVGVANLDIPVIASDPNRAQSWVQNNILNYKNVNIRYITVGNEISPLDIASSSIAPSVAPAMQNIQNAISAAGLATRIKVSTVVSQAVLGISYPPSAGQFNPQVIPAFIDPIVKFLVLTGSPLLVNVYPYFAYIGDQVNIQLDYALFQSCSPVVEDGKYQYFDLFSAMLDAFHAAMEKAGGANVELVVSETGWPSAGGTSTTLLNAQTYNKNLIKAVKRGTPRRPNATIETYIFDLVDENEKSPEVEKHWGVFLPNKQNKYEISFN